MKEKEYKLAFDASRVREGEWELLYLLTRRYGTWMDDMWFRPDSRDPKNLRAIVEANRFVILGSRYAR